jgi:hypothetical protein
MRNSSLVDPRSGCGSNKDHGRHRPVDHHPLVEGWAFHRPPRRKLRSTPHMPLSRRVVALSRGRPVLLEDLENSSQRRDKYRDNSVCFGSRRSRLRGKAEEHHGRGCSNSELRAKIR